MGGSGQETRWTSAVPVTPWVCPLGHGLGDERHLGSMHSLDHEEYCEDTSGSSGDPDEIHDFLVDTLWGDDSTGGPHANENWDQVNGTYKVFFVPMGAVSNCAGVFVTWINYIVMDDTASICGRNPTTGLGYACVRHDGRVCGDNHCHYNQARVYTRTGHLSGQGDGSRHVVNHESGHVLGLLDPCAGTGTSNCTQVNNNFRYCRFYGLFGAATWVDSIMHAPPSYCSSYGIFRAWVRPLDKVAAGAVINQP